MMHTLPMPPFCRPARVVILRQVIDEATGVAGPLLAGPRFAVRLREGYEADRLDAIRAAAAVPAECGPMIPDAPARGAFATFTPRRTDMTASGPRTRSDGYMGRRAMRVADAFDVMTEQAARRHAQAIAKAESVGADVPIFRPPFSVGQVEIGREYATLVERCAASGVKCSSLETLRVAASGGGDREAAMLRDFQRLRVLQRRIGDGLAKEVRRVRPGGRKRTAIRDRDLVDRVCLGGQTLTDVLERCGWGAKGESRDALRRSLCAALDRMRGYGLDRPIDRA